MTKLLNHINTYADLTAYNNDMSKNFPNISYIKGTDEVKWMESDPLLVIKYKVTSTSEATELINDNYYFKKQFIDGIEQQYVQMNYTFDTLGEHIVKYELKSNTLYKNLFFNNQNITEVQIPNNVTTILESCFSTCSNLTKAILSTNLTTVEKNIFASCSKLTDVKLPKTLTTIGIQMFRQTAITSINIPNAVTSIEYGAFLDCNSLSVVTIGSGVTSIGNLAFQICTSLTNITIKATTPPTLGNNVFDNTNNCPIYVPAESVDAYKAASGWSSYASRIQPIS